MPPVVFNLRKSAKSVAKVFDVCACGASYNLGSSLRWNDGVG
jgi:hypothetical protein